MVELLDLGELALRDLCRPERVFQLGTRARSRFPSLQSVDELPGNLPTQLTEFVGREAELRSVREALEIGADRHADGGRRRRKTRLALQFAAEAQPRFRHGAWLCELAPLTSPDAVGPLVAERHGCRTRCRRRVGHGDRRAVGRPGSCCWCSTTASTCSMRPRPWPMHSSVSCPEVVVLATSREGLGVAGERIMPVGSLALPRVDDRPEVVRTTDAVNLFVSRAARRAPARNR